MGDNRLTIDASGRLPLVPLGTDPSDAPGMAQKRHAQRQDVAVLFDKLPLFEPPLAIAKPAKVQEFVSGFDPLAKTNASEKQAVRSTPTQAVLDASHPEILRHNLVATRLQLKQLAANDPRRAQLEQRLQALESYDACKNAKPTLVSASQLPREVYSPEQLTSCTDKSGGCLPFDEAVAIEEKHQEVCAWTGVDPLRFEDLASGQAAADIDRESRELAEQAKWLHVVDAETQNPLAAAAAAYSIARGESLDATVARAELAQAVGGLAASVAAAGQKMPDFDTAEAVHVERALGQPAPDELTTFERRAIDSFLERHGVPKQFRPEVMIAVKSGTRIEKLDRDLAVYRNWGGGADERGRWVASEQPPRPRRDLALPPVNTCKSVSKWIIPKGTEILRGPAAKLFGQPGGAEQIYVPDPNVLKGPLP